MYMYMYYVNMYVYIYIPCTSASIRPKHAMTSGRSSRSASSSGSASAVFDGSGSSCAAWAPRSSAATAGPPAAPVDRWSQPKNPWNFFVAFACFLDATTIKQKKKQKNKKNDSFKNCEDFSKTNLYHLLFIDFLSPFLYPPGCVTRFAAAALSAACTWCIKGPRLAAPAAFGRWRAHDFYPTRNGWLFLGGNSRTSKIIIWFII